MPDAMQLPIHEATRYVVPLREGGSLPAILDTEAAGLFVAKFRGAGQGARALLAELIAGQLAQAVDLPMPPLALIQLDASFGRTERDPEIQDILKGSVGLNVGLGYLDGAFNYDAVATPAYVSPELAARIVWFDALITNIDRTARNPNLMIWNDQVWLIDHGAALYFHHHWATVDTERAQTPFGPIKDHVLLPLAGDLRDAHAFMTERLSPALVADLLDAIPDNLYIDAPGERTPPFPSAAANRAAYLDYFQARLEASERMLEGMLTAQNVRLSADETPLDYRR